jgi:hypothetical protein
MEEQEVSKLSSAELSVYINGTLSTLFREWSINEQDLMDGIQRTLDLSYIDEILSSPSPELAISDADTFLIQEAYRKACVTDPVMKSIFGLPTIPCSQSVANRSDFEYAGDKLNPSSLNDRDQMTFFDSISSVDLDKEGALEHHIHPIFRWENWQTPFNIDFGSSRAKDAWVAMAPAFILATKMLTSSATEGFWHQLMCGVLVKDEFSPYLAPCHLDQDPEYLRASFKKLLGGLQDRVKFCWAVGSDAHGWCMMAGFWGVLKRMDPDPALFNEIAQRYNIHRLGTRDFGGKNLSAYIGINTKYLHATLSTPFNRNRSVNVNARLHLGLAVTLCHELCHAIWMLRNIPSDKSPDILAREELVFATDFRAEMGASFENYLWRGAIVEPNMLSSQYGGRMRVHRWEFSLLFPTFCVALEDSFAEALFREKTWEGWDDFIAAMPRPTGQPSEFFAVRYLRSGPFANKLALVTYRDGVAIGETHECLNLERGPAGRDVEVWFREVRAQDMADACATGRWKMVKSKAGREFGSRIQSINAEQPT